MTSPTYPGVYIEEVPSEVRTITGVATSITAFIGRALRGPVDDATRVASYSDFVREFGGLWRDSMMSYAVQQFFLNGGKEALIIRVFKEEDGVPSTSTYQLGALTLVAANPGTWGDNLQITVDSATKDPTNTALFNLTINEVVDEDVVNQEIFRNLSIVATDSRFVTTVLEQESDLVRVDGDVPSDRPGDGTLELPTTNGSDGMPIADAEVSDESALSATRRGIWALDSVDLFNILCIPPYDRDKDVNSTTWSVALAYCYKHRAIVIVDPPASWVKPDDAADHLSEVVSSPSSYGAIYYPRIKVADPLQEYRLETFAPCGAVAGIMARTDADRGVWKAPAGQDATLSGVSALSYRMTDSQNGTLNQLGINCLRTFPVVGSIVWGARTLEGADRLASEWKYLPVRRLALFIEESLFRGTQWVIFEPNDEPLWSQIRLNVGAFMHNLFRQGAFQGSSPRDAYFVKCDSETTTQNDINLGIVNLLVGFAPLKPAEFLIIKISQIAGDIET